MWPRLSPAWSTLVTSNCTTRTPQLGTKAHHCLALQSFGLAPQSRALCAAPTAPLHMHWEPALVVLLHFPHLNLGPPTQPPPRAEMQPILQVPLTCQLLPCPPSGFLSCPFTWRVPVFCLEYVICHCLTR